MTDSNFLLWWPCKSLNGIQSSCFKFLLWFISEVLWTDGVVSVVFGRDDMDVLSQEGTDMIENMDLVLTGIYVLVAELVW